MFRVFIVDIHSNIKNKHSSLYSGVDSRSCIGVLQFLGDLAKAKLSLATATLTAVSLHFRPPKINM